MKKKYLIFIILILFMVSCTNNNAKEQESTDIETETTELNTDANSNSNTESATLDELPQPIKTAEAVASPKVSEKAPKPPKVTYILESNVDVDSIKKEAPISEPPHFYDEYIGRLIPNDNYGRIYPYIAEASSWREPIYGFCNENGEVICEAVYNQIETFEINGKEYYYAKAYNDFTTISSPDGSFTLTYDEIEYTRQGEMLEYLSVEKDDKYGVCDYDGNEILPPAYDEPVYFTNGLAVIYDNEKRELSYINTSGETVLGPYTVDERIYIYDVMQLAFFDDVAVIPKGQKYCFINKKGEIIFDYEFEYISFYYRNMRSGDILTEKGNETYSVIVLNGELFFGEEGYFCYRQDSYFICVTDRLDHNNKYYLDKNHNRFECLRSLDYAFYKGIEFVTGDNGYVYAIKKDNINGEKYVVENVRDLKELPNGNFICTVDYLYTIISKNGKIIKQLDLWGGDIIPKDSYEIYDEYFTIFSNGYYWNLVFDFDGELLYPEYRACRKFGDYYAVMDSMYCGLIDKDGNWVIKTVYEVE